MNEKLKVYDTKMQKTMDSQIGRASCRERV